MEVIDVHHLQESGLLVGLRRDEESVMGDADDLEHQGNEQDVQRFQQHHCHHLRLGRAVRNVGEKAQDGLQHDVHRRDIKQQ
ncbi:MAG: hypothetical protein Q4D19_02925 [Lautropia sp.]|nr:hypothetical protein [Lautropia sp.]